MTLKELRRKSPYKPSGVAQKLGISTRQLMRIEKAEVKEIDKYIEKLAIIYDTNIKIIKESWEETKVDEVLKKERAYLEALKNVKGEK